MTALLIFAAGVAVGVPAGVTASWRRQVHLRESHRWWETDSLTHAGAADRAIRHLTHMIAHPTVAQRAHRIATRKGTL